MRAIEFLTTQPVSTFLRKRYRVNERMLALKILLAERVLPWQIVKVLRSLKRRLL
jgi:hypothetical protein